MRIRAASLGRILIIQCLENGKRPENSFKDCMHTRSHSCVLLTGQRASPVLPMPLPSCTRLAASSKATTTGQGTEALLHAFTARPDAGLFMVIRQCNLGTLVTISKSKCVMWDYCN